MEDYQTTTDREEVLDFEFVPVPTDVHSQDVRQLCTACLCATRTTRTLDDGALKQYYMHILTEMQPEGSDILLQSPRVCWECESHLKRSVRFREQVKQSYAVLRSAINTCSIDGLAECLPSSVSRPERLKACKAITMDIAPQDDDAQVMTVTEHDGGDDAASESLDTNIERHFVEPFCDQDESIIISGNDDLMIKVESPLMSDYEGNDISYKQSEETFAYTRKQVRNDIKTINTPNSSNESTGDVNTIFVCDYCHKMFASKAELERHFATYHIYPHNNKTVPSPCEDSAVVLCSDDECSECPNKHNLQQHSNMKVLYKCEVCHTYFSQKLHFTDHLKTHTGLKPYPCELCNKSFSKNDTLVRHIRTHTGEKPYQCEVCHKSFSEKGTLVKHIRLHTGEKPYQCELCHKSFSSKPGLIYHLKMHIGEKPYQCEVCHKSFSENGTLVKHIRLHTGEKPYQCELCHKSFSSKSGFIYHLKMHIGKKPYQCKVCHKSFSEKGTLIKHIRIHTGETPYQCEACHKSFSQKRSLLRHLKIHTG